MTLRFVIYSYCWYYSRYFTMLEKESLDQSDCSIFANSRYNCINCNVCINYSMGTPLVVHSNSNC